MTDYKYNTSKKLTKLTRLTYTRVFTCKYPPARIYNIYIIYIFTQVVNQLTWLTNRLKTLKSKELRG